MEIFIFHFVLLFGKPFANLVLKHLIGPVSIRITESKFRLCFIRVIFGSTSQSLIIFFFYSREIVGGHHTFRFDIMLWFWLPLDLFWWLTSCHNTNFLLLFLIRFLNAFFLGACIRFSRHCWDIWVCSCSLFGFGFVFFADFLFELLIDFFVML